MSLGAIKVLKNVANGHCDPVMQTDKLLAKVLSAPIVNFKFFELSG